MGNQPGTQAPPLHPPRNAYQREMQRQRAEQRRGSDPQAGVLNQSGSGSSSGRNSGVAISGQSLIFLYFVIVFIYLYIFCFPSLVLFTLACLCFVRSWPWPQQRSVIVPKCIPRCRSSTPCPFPASTPHPKTTTRLRMPPVGGWVRDITIL